MSVFSLLQLALPIFTSRSSYFLCGEPSATHRPLCVSPLVAGASLRISVLWDIQLLLLPRSLMCVCCCCLSVHLCASSLLLYVCEMCVLLVQLVSLLRLKYLFSGTWMWLDILLYLQIYNCVSLIARLLTSLAILFFDAWNFVTISTSSDDRWGVQPRDIWIKAIRYGLFKVTLLFKLIPQLPSTQANDLLHNQPGSPEASHHASVLSRTALRLAFSYQSVITVLLRGDKRHSYKKLMGKWTDKEDVCIIWKTRKKTAGLKTYWANWWVKQGCEVWNLDFQKSCALHQSLTLRRQERRGRVEETSRRRRMSRHCHQPLQTFS